MLTDKSLQTPNNVAEWRERELNNTRILYSRGSWQKATKQKKKSF